MSEWAGGWGTNVICLLSFCFRGTSYSTAPPVGRGVWSVGSHTVQQAEAVHSTHNVRSRPILLLLILILLQVWNTASAVWNTDRAGHHVTRMIIIITCKTGSKKISYSLTPKNMAILEIFFFDMAVSSVARPSCDSRERERERGNVSVDQCLPGLHSLSNLHSLSLSLSLSLTLSLSLSPLRQ